MKTRQRNPNDLLADPREPGRMISRRQILTDTRRDEKEPKNLDLKIHKQDRVIKELETLKTIIDDGTLADQILWVCVQPDRKIPYFKDYSKSEAVFVRTALMRIRKALYASNKVVLADNFVKTAISLSESSEFLNDPITMSLIKPPSDNFWVEWKNLLDDGFDCRGFLLQRMSGSENLYRVSFYARQNIEPQRQMVDGVLAEIDDVDRELAGTINFSGVGIVFDPRGITDLQHAQTADDREFHDAITQIENMGVENTEPKNFRYTATGPDVAHWQKMLRHPFEKPHSIEEVEKLKLESAKVLGGGIVGQYKFLLSVICLSNMFKVTELDRQLGTKTWALDVDIDDPANLVRQRVEELVARSQIQRVEELVAGSQSPTENSIQIMEFGKPPFILNGGHRSVLYLLMNDNRHSPNSDVLLKVFDLTDKKI